MKTTLSNHFFHTYCPDVAEVYNLKEIYKHFNKVFFDNQLPKTYNIVWDGRLKTMWGVFQPKQKRIGVAKLTLDKQHKVHSTVLHEMIHLYLHLTNQDDGIEGHGPNFISFAVEINEKCEELGVGYRVQFYDQEITQEKATFISPLLGTTIGDFDDLDVARRCESVMKAAFDGNYAKLQ